MVRKVVGESRASPRARSRPRRRPRVLPAEQRDRLGLPLAARAMHDYEFVVADQKLVLPQGATRRAGAVAPAPWRENLQLVPAAHERRPAGRQRSTVRAWDPKTKQAVIGSASEPATTAQPGVAARAGRRRPRRRHDRSSPTASSTPTARRDESPRPRSTGSRTPSSRPRAWRSATRRSRPAPRSRSRASARSSAATFTRHLDRRTSTRAARLPDAFAISGRTSAHAHRR